MPADERQQRTAHLTGDEWLDLLSGGEIEIEGRLPYSSNYSYLVTVSSGGRCGRAVYKPGKGERPLWDFGTNLFRREIATYELSAAFGLGLVPETVLRHDAPLETGSLQRFIDADFSAHYFTLIEDRWHHPRLRELAAFDMLCNNADRKSGHVLIDAERGIWGIDNGLSFHADDKLRTVIWEFAGDAIPESVLEACERIATDGTPDRVASMIDDEECEALVRRARKMLRTRCLPTQRDDYRSYPWPLV
ncbi:MAG: SCO1664 family protein [Acidimicrobiales bacterium]